MEDSAVIVGNLDPWADSFPDGLVGELIELLVHAWQGMPTLAGPEIEDRITRRYVANIRKAKLARKLPFNVHGQYEVLDDAGDIVGRIDICAQHGHREDVYLAFECKRLNVADATGRVHRRASEYVLDGMVRFVEGRYAGPVGGMIGYVLDGDVSSAMSAVERALVAHVVRLAFEAPSAGLAPSARASTLPEVRQTVHRIGGRRRVLEHIFLACS